MKKIFLILLIAISLQACHRRHSTHSVSSTDLLHDFHSAAQPKNAVVKHLALNLKVDFENNTLSGFANWNIEIYNNANEIIFDTKDILIDKITLNDDSTAAKFNFDSADKIMGSALHIPILSTTKNVKIFYHTSPNALALQWLKPEQTAGKKQPFLFTQSEAILARSWIPCQDGPGVRFTYEANIHCPKNLMAVMSVADNPQSINASGDYYYSQPKPIPSYLMALAVGEIAFKKINERCGIYAELPMVEKVSWEFADMGNMVDAAEKLYGQYAWGRYDIVVLPPSFPFGGMENPCLTFATPTVIAGDRSLVSLVAHELAHSWSGNLTTNATWNDFWLNEGFTMYFQMRIMEALYGRGYSEMEASLTKDDLLNTMKEFGVTNADTKLKLDLKGRDPDDGMNDIAYNKGYLFLRLMEETAGRENWDLFLKSWFSAHAFQSVTTEEFVEFLNKNLITPNQQKFANVDINDWIYKPGLPSNMPMVKVSRFESIDTEIKNFVENNSINKNNTTNWSTHEWLYFINNLPKKLSGKQLDDLDAAFHFTGIANCEIADAWYLLALKNEYSKVNSAMEKFLCTVGRRKFLTPLYGEMMKTENGKKLATEIYSKARSGYHSVSQQTLDAMIFKVKQS
jgi:aminopeptidase N